MPTMDAADCQSLQIANACQYQLFDKPYALFVFKNAVNNVERQHPAATVSKAAAGSLLASGYTGGGNTMAKRFKYIADAYKWSKETAQSLRAGDFAAIDMEELIYEVESIAGSLRRELVSTLKDILESLLVLTYTNGDPEEADRQLVHAQGQLQLLMYSAPSLQEDLNVALEKAYGRAKGYVIEDYGVSLPDECPFPLNRITEDPYDRVMAEGKLA